MVSLAKKKCVPCEGGVQPLNLPEARTFLPELQADWRIIEEQPNRLVRMFRFKDFKQSMDFVNSVAKIAEQEGHHPDIDIRYNRVTLTLYTHAIRGLHENDFILAAKVDQLIG
ncbi:MAG TPA: 4a-hydroxytetrahydrobiopterin dehydratase [Candidatus Bilamarchaeaceae archaeon]|nr:4a-hydroxytetrahydrobiopterin dehydratase [Candidatus Bilamarchaeaceae archaeon]